MELGVVAYCCVLLILLLHVSTNFCEHEHQRISHHHSSSSISRLRDVKKPFKNNDNNNMVNGHYWKYSADPSTAAATLAAAYYRHLLATSHGCVQHIISNHHHHPQLNASSVGAQVYNSSRVKREGGRKRKKVIKIGVLAPAEMNHQYSIQKVIPPVMVAIKSERIRRKLPGWEFQVSYKDTKCSSSYGPLAAFDFHTSKMADVFLGPMCDYVIAPVARYSGVWNIPVITPGGQAEAFRHKEPEYPTLTRLASSYSMKDALLTILDKFKWRTIAMFYHNFPVGSGKGHSFCHFILGSVFTALNSTPHFRSFDEKQDGLDFHSMLKNISMHARIVVLCASPHKVREIMMAAEDLNMVSSGEYVFFNMELFTK